MHCRSRRRRCGSAGSFRGSRLLRGLGAVEAQGEVAELAEVAAECALAQGEPDDRNDQQDKDKGFHDSVQMSIPRMPPERGEESGSS